MSLPHITLDLNKNNKTVLGVTIRKTEKGQVLISTIIDADSSPYDLTGLNVSFNENKENDKFISDTNVNIVDARNGIISYVLHSQAYAAQGEAWFEISDSTGDKVDSTQSFTIAVDDGLNASAYNTNYVDKLEKIRTEMEAVEKGASDDLAKVISDSTSKVDKMITDLESQYSGKTTDLQQAYDDVEKNLQDQLAKITKDSNDKLNTDSQNAINDVNAKADAQRKAIDDEWTTTEAGLNAKVSQIADELATIEKNIGNTNTGLSTMDKKADAVQAKVDSLKADIGNIDFSSYATKIDLTNYAKTTDTYTKTEIDDKNKDINAAISNAGKVKTASLNGGTKVVPDDAGNLDLTVPEPDLSKYVTNDSLKSQLVTINNTVTGKPSVYVDYDESTALDISKTHDNTFVIVPES